MVILLAFLFSVDVMVASVAVPKKFVTWSPVSVTSLSIPYVSSCLVTPRTNISTVRHTASNVPIPRDTLTDNEQEQLFRQYSRWHAQGCYNSITKSFNETVILCLVVLTSRQLIEPVLSACYHLRDLEFAETVWVHIDNSYYLELKPNDMMFAQFTLVISVVGEYSFY